MFKCIVSLVAQPFRACVLSLFHLVSCRSRPVSDNLGGMDLMPDRCVYSMCLQCQKSNQVSIPAYSFISRRWRFQPCRLNTTIPLGHGFQEFRAIPYQSMLPRTMLLLRIPERFKSRTSRAVRSIVRSIQMRWFSICTMLFRLTHLSCLFQLVGFDAASWRSVWKYSW